ncbi:Beta_elim_lyase domain-containing protein, partial [Cephalotus follicularis]
LINTQTHVYIYIYIYISVCVCVFFSNLFIFEWWLVKLGSWNPVQVFIIRRAETDFGFEEHRNSKVLAKMVTRTVDLRSDTVTKPTEAMRVAMASAEVDDDVIGYDPTAFRLETEMAKLTDKEAALFVPSGTMGNLISVLVHCEFRGSEVILGDMCHIHIYENGGISTIGGVHPRTIKTNKDGTLDIDLIEAAIRDPSGELMYPTTRLICLENTHANSGGRCLPVEYIDKVGELAKKHGLKLHIDGARIFNASVALGVPVHRLVQAADSVSICLSKGLGAPVGSVIVGSKDFIAKAKRLRKTLGGGMRQVGILCAAALVALKENVAKLEGDHKNTKMMAEGLSQIKGLKVDLAAVETNIIFIDILESSKIAAQKLSKNLEEHGILTMQESSTRIRIVLHHQISASDVQYTLSCFQKLFQRALTGVAEENGN